MNRRGLAPHVGEKILIPEPALANLDAPAAVIFERVVRWSHPIFHRPPRFIFGRWPTTAATKAITVSPSPSTVAATRDGIAACERIGPYPDSAAAIAGTMPHRSCPSCAAGDNATNRPNRWPAKSLKTPISLSPLQCSR